MKSLTFTAIAAVTILGSAPSLAQNAYITNYTATGTVSVINTVTDKVIATIPVGSYPNGVAVSPNGRRVYVGNEGSASLSVIDTKTNAMIATIGTRDVVVGLRRSREGEFDVEEGGTPVEASCCARGGLSFLPCTSTAPVPILP